MLMENSAVRKLAKLLQTIMLKPLQHLPRQMRIAVHWCVLPKVLIPMAKVMGTCVGGIRNVKVAVAIRDHRHPLFRGEDSDCLSGNCRAYSCADDNNRICVNNKCTSAGQCGTDRCEQTKDGKWCLPKVRDCVRCSADNSDCLSKKCRNYSCANRNGRICLGDACPSSDQYDNGHYDGTGNGKKCLAKVEDCGRCSGENSDCLFGNCRNYRKL